MALEAVQSTSRKTIEPTSSPRISFSADFLDENTFISINPHSQNEEEEAEKDQKEIKEKDKARVAEFEFLSSNVSSHAMLTADELFFEGKLLPCWQMQHSEKLKKINLKTKDAEQEEEEEEEIANKEESRVSWFVDDDPSPRPPKCTVLWKELLRLKKQRASSLSPSSSSSSTSSSSSSLADIATADEGKEGSGDRDKHVKRIKKGLERTRSASIRIRPMINVPICTQVKSSALPPLFPLKKGRLER
ncbi:histone-lysine N-methyltransferase SETD1A-like [Durio zibethinus]|uniref:Histone-lysine N-methyltransferase SETD1A-like n=1 Tax=Durio zibethinus TaxID=66656 RepID=A0A6P6A7H1_DURZI|nr:histone-lysine N-methyltransferase SETD1A-like [Durio zibethinus]